MTFDELIGKEEEFSIDPMRPGMIRIKQQLG
jgi:hypothetical protein